MIGELPESTHDNIGTIMRSKIEFGREQQVNPVHIPMPRHRIRELG